MRGVEEPVFRQGRDADETIATHPAFAQIGVSRVSGGIHLYDSDFQHNHYMVIRINESQLHRNYSRDWHHENGRYIEVALSEAQWATFVSSPNMGSGVPCTLTALRGEMIPALPAPASRKDQFSKEMNDAMKDAMDALHGAIKDLENLPGSKKAAREIQEKLQKTVREITKNMPFVASQFEEHVENTTERAKMEIHGYIQGAVNRAGVAAIAGGSPILEIGGAEKENPDV